MTETSETPDLDTIERLAESIRSATNGIVNAAHRLTVTARPVDPHLIHVEPPRGSVMLLRGLTGTAYQRLHIDGRYHCTVPGIEPASDFGTLLNRAGADGVILVHMGSDD